MNQQVDGAVPSQRKCPQSPGRLQRALAPDTAGVNPAARSTQSRGAFTLVEILMVITIIAILMTITIQVVGAFIGQAREAATSTTLSKIQSLMNSRRQAFDRLTQRKGFFTGSFEYQFAQKYFPANTAKPVANKLLQIKYFPQSANDLNFLMQTVFQTNPAAQLQLANMYPKLFQSFTNNPNGFVAPSTLANLTNQEILYNVLTENVIGDSPLGTDSFSSAEVVTEPLPQVTTAGLPYFADAWKKEILFYRWPTRLFRSGGVQTNGIPATITSNDILNAKLVFTSLPVFTGNLANDLGRDPDDPLQSCTAIPNFEGLIVNGNTMPAFHTPASFHMPIIVSAGPDGNFGMALPDAADVAGPPAVIGRLATVVSQDALADNLVSASIKSGGK